MIRRMLGLMLVALLVGSIVALIYGGPATAATCDPASYVQPAVCNEFNPPGPIPMTEFPPLPDTGGYPIDPTAAIGFALLAIVLGMAVYVASVGLRERRQARAEAEK